MEKIQKWSGSSHFLVKITNGKDNPGHIQVAITEITLVPILRWIWLFISCGLDFAPVTLRPQDCLFSG